MGLGICFSLRGPASLEALEQSGKRAQVNLSVFVHPAAFVKLTISLQSLLGFQLNDTNREVLTAWHFI